MNRRFAFLPFLLVLASGRGGAHDAARHAPMGFCANAEADHRAEDGFGEFNTNAFDRIDDHRRPFAAASGDFRFAVAVAGFGMILRESPHRGSATLDAVLQTALEETAADPGGHRAEFVALLRQAAAIKNR